MDLLCYSSYPSFKFILCEKDFLDDKKNKEKKKVWSLQPSEQH